LFTPCLRQLASAKDAYFLEKVSDNENLHEELRNAAAASLEQEKAAVSKIKREYEQKMHTANAAYFDEKISESQATKTEVQEKEQLIEETKQNHAQIVINLEREKLVILEQLNHSEIKIEEENANHKRVEGEIYLKLALQKEAMELKQAEEKETNLKLAQALEEERQTSKLTIASVETAAQLDKLKMEEELHIKVGLAESQSREERFFKEEAVRGLEMAESKAEGKAERRFEERAWGLQETHDLEMSQLIKTWEARLEVSEQERRGTTICIAMNCGRPFRTRGSRASRAERLLRTLGPLLFTPQPLLLTHVCGARRRRTSRATGTSPRSRETASCA